MYNLNVSFYRGIQKADIDITGITLIAGDNHQGKSSIADALGSLLTGEVLPEYVMKKDSKDMVHSLSGTGCIMLKSGDNDTVIIDYPIAKLTAAGKPPESSKVSVGMSSPVLIPDTREKANYFSELLKTEPSKDDLKKAIKSANISDEYFESLWSLVESLSWNGAWERAKDKGKELKGVWKNITAESYGKNKGEIWKPEGWIVGLESKSCDDLKSQRDKLSQKRDKAIAVTAVDDSEMKRLQGYADGNETAKLGVSEQQKIVDDSLKELDKHTIDTPSVLTNDYQKCPSCGDALAIDNGKIVKCKKNTKKQIDDSQKAYDKHKEKKAALQTASLHALEKLVVARSLLKESNDAIETLAEQNKSKPSGKSAEDYSAEIEEIEFQLLILTSYLEAKSAHNNIYANSIIAEALSPEGVRKNKLDSGIVTFNKRLLAICKNAGWGSASVDNDLNFKYNGRSYHLISKSEKFRLRTAIQLTASEFDNSKIIVIDGVDIMTKKGRNGLITVLNEMQKTALICVSMDSKDDMPDMSKVGGNSYWIEGGEVK